VSCYSGALEGSDFPASCDQVFGVEDATRAGEKFWLAISLLFNTNRASLPNSGREAGNADRRFRFHVQEATSVKTYYDILGVPPNASWGDIRKAYLLRSKMLHPDRFNQSRQKDEWHLANEMLKELNHAYSIVKEPSSRAAYDRSFGRSASPPPQNGSPPARAKSEPEARRGPPPPPLGKLCAGRAVFLRLPQSIRHQLLDRQADVIKTQTRVRIDGVRPHYFFVLLCAGWFVLLFNFAHDLKWQNKSLAWYAVFSAAACALGALCAARIIRWHHSPLKCDFYVTPLYFIRTDLEKVSYWPIWELRDIRATHRYRNGAYMGTDVSMIFPQGAEQITTRPLDAYSRIIDVLRVFEQKRCLARQLEDWWYFYNEDDFREVPDFAAPTGKAGSTITAGAWIAAFAMGAILFFTAFTFNIQNAHPSNLAGAANPATVAPMTPSWQSDTPPRKYASYPNSSANPAFSRAIPRATPPPLPVNYLEPVNGFVFKNKFGPGQGSLTVSNGTNSHAVVKLIDLIRNTAGYTVFVRAGAVVTILFIPNGRYRLVFATGRGWNDLDGRFRERHGSSRFDEPLVFSTSQRVEGNQIVTYYDTMQITLNTVVNGNAKIDNISDSDFERF
jgi:DnaJ-domain-containing protein 1